jgi:hypothetical protein
MMSRDMILSSEIQTDGKWQDENVCVGEDG